MDICSALYRHTKIKTDGKSVLDLGCGHASIFPYLYHRFKIKSYTGVDKEQEKDLFSDPKNPVNPPGFINIIKENTCYNFSWDDHNDFYSLYHTTSNKILKVNNILIETEFSKYFQYHQFGVSKFLQNNKLVFDFIILSNFLHFFEFDYAKKLYNKCRNIITNNGYIYVKVANDQHPRNKTVKWGLNQNELLSFIKPTLNTPVINYSGSNISILCHVK